MRRARNREQLWETMRAWKGGGLSIALVPTMGNLHAGHLALVEAAAHQADRVVTSIYVNPTQFGEGEDFGRYPRSLEADCSLLDAAGCHLVFIPDDSTMYPAGLADAVRVQAPPSLSASLEGACRPGHLDGVVSVVERLFNLVRPDVAFFGEKDYQQLLVVQRLAEDLGHGIRIVGIPTVREDSGLAMSSRNSYLDAGQAGAAAQLNRVLHDVADAAASGISQMTTLEDAARERLEQLGMRVDYLVVRRAADLAPPQTADRDLRVLAAVWCGNTRLIDNLPVDRACNHAV